LLTAWLLSAGVSPTVPSEKAKHESDFMIADNAQPVLNVTYRFAGSDEKGLDRALRALQAVAPGDRQAWGNRASATDLLTFLEVALGLSFTLAVKPALTKYFEGLLDTESLKALGAEHRLAVENWLGRLRAELTLLATQAHDLIAGGLKRLWGDKEEALAFVAFLGSAECYIVLNDARMSEALVRDLPCAFKQLLGLVARDGLPDDAHVLQLYFDRSATRWKYLFAPTAHGFGNYIDRYIELDSGRVYHIKSNGEFRRLFDPTPDDQLKFLVNPFRDVMRDVVDSVDSS